MNPVEQFPSFPEFANAGIKQAPGSAKYSAGFLPSETFPSEYANYFFNGSTKGITKLNAAVASIWNELNNILTAFYINADSTQASQLLSVLNKVYPQICECSTAAATQNKSVALSGNVLKPGSVYVITMTYGNTYGDGSSTYPTLSFNSGTAYPLCDINGAYLKSGAWNAGDQIKVLFDGTKFLMSTGGVVDFLQSGLLKPVSSRAVHQAVNNINSIIVSNDASYEPKTIVFPNGYNVAEGNTIKVLFINGNDPINTQIQPLVLNPLTINGVAVVVNRNGTLVPLLSHFMPAPIEKYYMLQAGTILEMYYTEDYDNNGTPGWVIIGNPVVLSRAEYKIYANGDIDHLYVHNIHKQLFSNSGTSALQTFDLYTLDLTKDPNGLYEVGINLAMYDDDNFKCYVYSDVDGDNSNNAPGMTAANTNYHIQGTTNTRHCFINMKIFVKRYLYFRAVDQGEQVTLNVISVKPIRSMFIEAPLPEL